MERSTAKRGRPPGSRNKRTLAAAERIATEGLTPLEYLTSVYRDQAIALGERIDAAKAAAPYLHAKLQPVDGQGSSAQRVQVEGALKWQPPQ